MELNPTNMLKKILTYFNKLVLSKCARLVFNLFWRHTRYRFLNTNPFAIGHFVGDIDFFLKERELRLHNYRGVLLAPKHRVANPYILLCWKQSKNLLIIENQFCCYFLDYLRIFPESGFDCSNYQAINGRPAKGHLISKLWGERQPIISLHQSVLARGKVIFEKHFPMVDKTKIVLLHCRDSLFDRNTQNNNYHSQRYRNSTLRSYSEIINFLRDEHFTVVRIGDFERGPSEIQSFFDLMIFDEDTRRLLECYLSSIHRFFLGSMSGPFILAEVWKRPLFRLNCLPIENLRSSNAKSLSVPKVLRRNGNIIPISKIFSSGIYKFNTDQLYSEHEITYEENKAEDAMADFMDFYHTFIDGRKVDKVGADLSVQKLYRSIVPPDSFDYHSTGNVGSFHLKKMGLSNLKKNFC